MTGKEGETSKGGPEHFASVQEPVAWRGIDLDMVVLAVWYRIDKGPWQIADSLDRVPAGAELHPCHLQREE
jgi:hypothetical protein